jgi:hypothetical protein
MLFMISVHNMLQAPPKKLEDRLLEREDRISTKVMVQQQMNVIWSDLSVQQDRRSVRTELGPLSLERSDLIIKLYVFL